MSSVSSVVLCLRCGKRVKGRRARLEHPLCKGCDSALVRREMGLPRNLCGACGRNDVSRSRGLCDTCWRRPEVRRRATVSAPAVVQGVAGGQRMDRWGRVRPLPR